MKRTINILLFLSLITMEIQGQFSVLVEAGANYGNSKFTGIEMIKTEPIYGYYFALTPSIDIIKNFNVNLEMQYSSEGYNSTNENFHDSRYTYIRFIPEIEYSILDNLGVFAGVNLGYSLIERIRSNGTDWVVPFGGKLIKDFDGGALIGVRIEVKKLSFVIKYNYGFLNVNNLTFTDVNGNPIGSATQNNRVLQFGLAYRIGKS